MTVKCEEMSVAALAGPAKETSVGMGLVVLAAAPRRLTAVLGSCVGITIYSPRLQLGMLGHVVLPRSNGRQTCHAKYADTAVSYMRMMLEQRGAKPDGLVAKIVGGARMFGEGVHNRIGEANAEAAVAALENAGIPIAGREVGGVVGRRISFDLATGRVTVESIGRKSRTF